MNILVLGIGNVGTPYRNTRHNIGFMAIDNLAYKLNIDFKEDKKLNSFVAEISLSSDINLLLVKPTTFVNLTKNALIPILKTKNLDKIVIIYDNLDSIFGSLHFKDNPGSGGHNGIKSIKEVINNFLGIKVGIGANLFTSFIKNKELIKSIDNKSIDIFIKTLKLKYENNSIFHKNSFLQVLKKNLVNEEAFLCFEKVFKYSDKSFNKTQNEDVSNYVLSKFNSNEMNCLESFILNYISDCIIKINSLNINNCGIILK